MYCTICSWPNSSSKHPTSLLLVFQTQLWSQHCTSWPDGSAMHRARFSCYCITPESLCSVLKALGFDLDSICAQQFLTNHYKTPNKIAERIPQQPTPQAAAVIGDKTKGGHSIPNTYIWKHETLTIPVHPGNLVAEQETKPRPLMHHRNNPFPVSQSRNFLPYDQVLTDTSACLCDRDRLGWDPTGGHSALKSRSNTGGQAPLSCSWHNISFQTKTLVIASSTSHEAIDNCHCFQCRAHGCSKEAVNSSSFILG